MQAYDNLPPIEFGTAYISIGTFGEGVEIMRIKNWGAVSGLLNGMMDVSVGTYPVLEPGFHLKYTLEELIKRGLQSEAGYLSKEYDGKYKHLVADCIQDANWYTGWTEVDLENGVFVPNFSDRWNDDDVEHILGRIQKCRRSANEHSGFDTLLLGIPVILFYNPNNKYVAKYMADKVAQAEMSVDARRADIKAKESVEDAFENGLTPMVALDFVSLHNGGEIPASDLIGTKIVTFMGNIPTSGIEITEENLAAQLKWIHRGNMTVEIRVPKWDELVRRTPAWKGRLLGKIVGGYRLLETLAQDGLLEVYKVQDILLGSEMSLEIGRIALSGEWAARFEWEAKSLLRLEHPNLLRVLDVGIYQGLPYLVLSIPLGLNLELLLQAGKRFGCYEAASLLIGVARGLEFMHRLGLVHGAVRPSAIWVGADGQARLAGFTAGWLLDDRISKKVSTVFLAPEQVSGGVVDLRADIYALGMVLEKSHDKNIRYTGEMEGGREKSCKKALSIDPAGRFQSLEEMIPRLEELAGIIPPWKSRLLRMLEAETKHVRSAAFSPDGNILATGGDTVVRLWHVRDGQLLQMFDLDSFVYGLAFCPDGTILAAAAGGHNKIRLWQVRNGQLLLLRTLDQNPMALPCIAFSPDGATLAAGVLHKVQLWRVHDGQLLQSFDLDSLVRSIAFSPNGMILAAGTDPDMYDNCIWMWEVCGGLLLRTLGQGAQVESIAFSPDGTILASGNVDGDVCLWQMHNGELLQTFESYFLYYDEDGPQFDTVNNIAFSPNGTILASVGNNNVRLWRLRYGQLLQALEGNHTSGKIVAFRPDGTILAVGGYDGLVRLWEMQI